MNAINISFNINTAQGSNPSIIVNSYVNMVTGNASHYTHQPAAELLNDRPGQFAAVLAWEISKPLGNLSLAMEMLENATLDNDLNIYMGVITRNSVRINNLIHEFQQYLEAKVVTTP